MLRKHLLPPGGNTWARPCDTCAASPCRVYCRADAAYLCSGCDARVHAANQVASRHERVCVCESCERAPAAFLCKADSASLCATCDADVHSANPLARRHHRIPILPLSGPSSTSALGNKKGATLPMAMARMEDEIDEEDEDEAASWLLLNPPTNTNKGYKNNNDTAANGCFLGADVDDYLDLVEYTSINAGDNAHLSDHERSHYDIMVPSGGTEGKDAHDPHGFQIGVEFDIKPGYAYNGSSISHSVSVSSSLEVGIVPESTVSDISTTHHPHPLQQMPMQLSPLERQARVLRYREKKKTRKFEKTIRYASRKAYAEKRPRIKGRFAKRTDGEVQMFTNPMMADGGYGIVPSF